MAPISQIKDGEFLSVKSVICGSFLHASLALSHDDFQGFGGGMGSQFNGGSGLRERKLVSDEPVRIELPREDQPRHFLLQPEIRRVTPDQVLLIHTDCCQVNGRLSAAPGVGEEQHLAGAAD